jgi:hypothetical protein
MIQDPGAESMGYRELEASSSVGSLKTARFHIGALSLSLALVDATGIASGTCTRVVSTSSHAVSMIHAAHHVDKESKRINKLYLIGVS